jgi:ribonuclease HI
MFPFRQRNPLILTIKEELLSIEEAGKLVHFYWIPAHIGIIYNELADTAAKESVYTGTHSKLLPPWTDHRAS